MLAFSTCWNGSRHQDGEALVDEILELGFDTIEISHGLSVSRLPGLQSAFKAGKMKVSGLHNFFPAPVDVMIDAPDCFEFTSHRSLERDRALHLTRKTLEMAAEFKASYVVLHLGSVPGKRHSERLFDLIRTGKQNSPEFVKMKLRIIRHREKKGHFYYRRARQALESIAEWAEEFAVPVAVESRSSYEQTPSEREMVELMLEFKDCPWVGYWHDFGHVQLKHNLGLLDHREWLQKMRPHLIGCHLHDVQWPARDHCVPLTGAIEYDNLIPMVSPNKYVVWEISPRRRAQTIREKLPLWKEKYGNEHE